MVNSFGKQKGRIELLNQKIINDLQETTNMVMMKYKLSFIRKRQIFMVFDRMRRKLKKRFLRNCLIEFEVIIQKKICFPK